MFRRLLPILATSALLGCVAFPHAGLSVSAGVRQQVAAPVICGPMGFRKTPLQARWGEYVRVTVQSAVTLRGTALLHANGVTWEPRAWSTDRDGAIVLETRFENLDPDQRFALANERPIDITLTGLEAPAGGSCEGAVFTVEQGALVPTINEHAWLAELERRGGPALAARRAAARAEMEARRQAHYASWAARQQVERAAEVLAQADAVRLAHYAAWDARHAEQLDATVTVPAVELAVLGAGSAELSATAAGEVESGSGAAPIAGGRLDSTTATGPEGSSAAVSASGSGSVFVAADSTSAAVATSAGDWASFGGGACAAPSSGAVLASSLSTERCVGCGAPTVATSCVDTPPAPAPVASLEVVGSAAGSVTTSQSVTVSTQVGADVVASAPGEWASFEADVAWSQPSDAQLRVEQRTEWSDPWTARLEAVPVSVTSEVAVGTRPPLPEPPPACTGGCGAEVGFAVALPAVFQVLSQVAALAPLAVAPPGQRVILAVPVGTPR